MSIKIITDNCCDLGEDLLSKYRIELIHALVRFGEHEFQPGELTTEEFYQRMISSPVLPTTSQPSRGEMKNVFSTALEDGSDVIVITMSSGISGTFQSALMVKEMLGNPQLHVVDSKKASVGQGLMALEAARMVERGESLNNILARLQYMQYHLQCIFAVDNIEYLIKGGRISRTKGLLANVLDIKPILRFDKDGYIVPYEKSRGHKAVLNRLLYIMEKLGVNLPQQIVGVSHSHDPESAQYLVDAIQSRFGVKEIIVGEIGPIIGSHVGPGTFSVFFESEPLW